MAGIDVVNLGRDGLLRRLLGQSTEHALVILDVQARIVAWLAGSETIFGYTSEEVVGKNFAVLFTPEDIAQGAPETELDIAQTGSAAENDRWMQRRDGVQFWATGVLQAIRGDDGELLGFGKVLRNRTDLKSQLESQEREIEKLRSGDERKNSFIATLAHELRNPLGSLSTATEVLRHHVRENEDGAFAITIVQRQIDAMRRLVEDLLDVTRINAGKLKLELREVELGELLKTSAAICRPRIDDRTHDFNLILSPTPVLVLADAMRLQQVFVNLIENAAKYTEYGGTIWVKLLVEADAAVVKVEDSGIGIAPETLPRIFDLFTQAELSGEQPHEGLGIGLSVVKDITRLHGGSVQVRSDGIGKGSEFTVRLPLAPADRQARPDSPTGE